MNELQETNVVDELTQKIRPLFSIYEIQEHEGRIYFFGLPKKEIKLIYEELWSVFSLKGFEFSMKYELGEHVLVASPFAPVKERRWINVVLLIATFFTTMLVGSLLYGADIESNPSDVLQGIPFSIAIMTVLGAHEAGHYFVAKKHGMQTSLPYFIPFPSLIGTMGAIIKHRGPIPGRKALFDVGVSGPLIGLFASVVVTVIGLLQPPLQFAPEEHALALGIPPLFGFIMSFFSIPDTSVMNPIAFAGWAGMLVTALNLIPAGQLDGGHVLRAMIGEKASRVSAVLPAVLFFIGAFLIIFMKTDGFMWIFWSALLLFFSAGGHPRPLNDDIPIDRKRMLLGVITFALGLLCLTPVPFQML
ncbi:MAG: site-2 protease family protein [Methanosarcinales archaeon]|nr:MAG: site-2 protease family protein [Methanosarcinales archaeon]